MEVASPKQQACVPTQTMHADVCWSLYLLRCNLSTLTHVTLYAEPGDSGLLLPGMCALTRDWHPADCRTLTLSSSTLCILSSHATGGVGGQRRPAAGGVRAGAPVSGGRAAAVLSLLRRDARPAHALVRQPQCSAATAGAPIELLSMCLITSRAGPGLGVVATNPVRRSGKPFGCEVPGTCLFANQGQGPRHDHTAEDC